MNSYIQRAIYPEISAHLLKKQITVLTGMRRTGKTTLIQKILDDEVSSNKIDIDLERLDNRDLFSEKNYDNIITALTSRGLNFQKKAIIAIDEIQMLPQIVSVIKYLYDHYRIKFVIIGSSSFYIKNLFTDSLAGRKKVFVLHTLSFEEYLLFKGIEYTNFTPLKRNIHKLLKMLSSRACSRLDYSKLSSLTGISRPTVHNYIDLYENTFTISRINVMSKNPDREIVKA